MAPEIKTVAVISTGVIGLSMTSLFLANGLRVIVCSTSSGAEERVANYLEQTWPLLEQVGLAPGASKTNYKVVGPTLDGYWDEIDFIQENAPEHVELKTKLIAELDANAPPDVIIASSSSGLPSSKFITDCKKHPERVLIAHPVNPPHLMPLVEVVPHPGTDPKVSARTLELFKSLGKKPILVRQELPGFVANRLQATLLMEAFSLILRGVITAEELDDCMTGSLGLRWAIYGPSMAAVMGGGGGKDGFLHVIRHLLPAVKVWVEDMKENVVEIDDKNVPIINDSIQEMLAKYDMKTEQLQRGKLLIDLLKAKDNLSKSK